MLSHTLIRESRIEALVSKRASVAYSTGVVVSLELSEMERLFMVYFAFCLAVFVLELLLGIKRPHVCGLLLLVS